METVGYNPSIGETVWIKPTRNTEYSLPWSGKVLKKVIHNRVRVLCEDGKEEVEVMAEDVLGRLSPSDVKPLQDMIQLSDLSEKSILRNIYIRYLQNLIYTYTGGILVSVNPYKRLEIYSETEVEVYRGARGRLGGPDLPPHIFALGANTLDNLKRNLMDQSIVISGETGSGKTECTKLLLNFFAATSSKSDAIGRKIIQANPILEAFGNAKTTKNDNSSRFGKYIEIGFRHDGTIRRACIQHYLLEKARVKTQNIGDRNYHIFYTILAGLSPEAKEKLKLSRADNYFYLKQGRSMHCEGRNEKREFSLLQDAFKTLNFPETWSMFQILAAILHIGNFIYKTISKGNEEETQIVDNLHLEMATKLLSVKESHFIEALTHKTILVEGNKVVSELTIEQAVRSRDAFATSLYNQLFSYIVTTINKSISDHKVSRTSYSIGILDIFGFENFSLNSFEQFCINYANEHLQQFFVNHVFKLEQEEYMKEGIKWENIEYEDNREVLNLMGLDKMSILVLLDEQTKFPKGNDTQMLLKCNQNHSSNKYYIKPKSEMSTIFGIRHYAGTVTYSTEGFIEKNMNALSLEWKEVVRESDNTFLKDLFVKELNSLGRGASPLTLAGGYRQSLDSLMSTLQAASPYFIRCIKPNSTKEPNVFDQELVCQQLRYSGMMETAKIRQIGFPIRYTYMQFILRYRILVPGSPPISQITNLRATSQQICEKFLRAEDYAFGKTKIFLKIPDEKLEAIRDRILTKSAVCLQKSFRAMRLRNQFLREKEAAVVIQRYWRGSKPRASYLALRRGHLRLQAVLRARQLQASYTRIRSRVINLQARCRGYLKRKELQNPHMKPAKKLGTPIPKPRKNSVADIQLDSYITDMFENAIGETIGPLSSDMKDYLKPSIEDDVDEILKNPEVLSFPKYAAAHFMGNVTGKFTNKIWDQPLLDFSSPGDQMAGPVLWVSLLRWMGDLPETSVGRPGSGAPPIPRTRKSILSQLQATLSKSYLHSKEFNKLLRALQDEERKASEERLEFGKKKLLNMTLIHRNKLGSELERARLESEALKNSYQEWLLGPPASLLEKLYFIIGHGILRPNLRDEIYCQLCKQLTENPNPVSCMYGWILFSLVTTSFPPSERLAPTILHFIASSGNMLGSLRKLQRTLLNGARSQPPSAFELSALKQQQKMLIDVFLLDDSTVGLEVDPATNARELVKAISSKKNIEDTFGYSIVISMLGQVVSLESDSSFLMDGICQCELRASERGLPEIAAPWNVIFKREVFPPWPLSAADSVSTHLTYCQIIRGVALGEYRYSQECELSLLVAQHYYVQCGRRLLPEILDSLIREVIPEPLRRHKNINWAKYVSDTFHKSYFIKLKISEEDVKMDVVNYAKKKWPLLFSRYYEVTQVAGIYLGRSSDLLLALNSEGVYLCRNSTDLIWKIHYYEIHSVDHVSGESSDKDELHLLTIRLERYVFKSVHASRIHALVRSVLAELLQRTKYAVAVSDFTPPDDGFLRLRRGQLVVLDEAGGEGWSVEGARGGSAVEGAPGGSASWLRGHLLTSGQIGEFPKNLVRPLATLSPPPPHILKPASESLKIDQPLTKGNTHALIVKKHTLESYALKYFRLEDGPGGRGSGTLDGDLLKHTSRKLWSPLHRGLSPLGHLVTRMFNAILVYMGDSSAAVPQSVRHTRPIFEPPLQYEVLRDELYCLILKQLSYNPSADSQRSGWELLLLAASLFPPSSVLIKDVEDWLRSRPGEMSCLCLEAVRSGGPARKYPHHHLELSAVQHSLPLLVPIVFPNNMEQIFEVTSRSSVSWLVEEVSEWLGLSSSQGFSIILVSGDASALALPSEELLFDAILAACHFPDTATGSETPKYKYDLMFVKKLWLNTYAGIDRTADLVCHFYQELPKYLAGSHNCTVSDAMLLAAFIFIAESDDNRSQIDPPNEILKKIQQLVPSQLVTGLSPEEWMYGIERAYQQHKDLKSDEAKILFLKTTQNWPNFGSAFFSVHSSSKMEDAALTLVVNRSGVCLVHPYSQDIIGAFGYGEIVECSFNDTSLSLSLSSSRVFTWYTKMAQKIADLVNSYLDAFDHKYLVS